MSCSRDAVATALSDGFDNLAYGSPIFKVVREKRYKAFYTPVKRSPTAPKCALVRGSEPSNIDRLDVPPQSPSASPLETLRAIAPLSVEPFPAWDYPRTDPISSPLLTPTDDAPQTPTASRPCLVKIFKCAFRQRFTSLPLMSMCCLS